MTEFKGGARTFFHARGANAQFCMADIDFSSICTNHFHIGYALLLDQFDADDETYGTVMAKALDLARKNGMKTSLDVVSENSARFMKIVTPSLKYCDYLIINEIEASLIAELPVRCNGELDLYALEEVSRKLLDKGVNEKIIIHAPEGACTLDKTGDFIFVPSLKLPSNYIKGTVGAGDAFCAGILYALYQGYDNEQALKIGAGAAACSLSEFNSVDGMKRIAEIEILSQQIWKISFLVPPLPAGRINEKSCYVWRRQYRAGIYRSGLFRIRI